MDSFRSRLLSRVRGPGSSLVRVVLGKGVLMGANTALLLVLASRLPLAAYGMFIAIASAQVVLSRAVLAGMDGGVVRLSNAADGFGYEACVGAGIVILRRTAMTIIAAAAVMTALPLPWPRWVPAVTAAGAIGIALVDYGYFRRLARLDYRGASLVQGAMGILRLLGVLAALTFWPGRMLTVFVAYAAGSLVTGLLQLRSAANVACAPAPGNVRHLFRYSVWQGSASMIAAAALHAGTFVFTALRRPDSAGLFGLGLSISLAFFFLYNAFFEFLLPRLSRMAHETALGRSIAIWTGVAFALAAACAPVAAVVGIVLPRFFRPDLAPAIPVFYWLAASQVLLLPQAVFEAASHALLRPHFVAATWALRLVATASAVLLLARNGDPVRGAMAQAFAAAMALIVLAMLVLARLQRSRAMVSAQAQRGWFSEGSSASSVIPDA